jgi:pimeloyl-ACP methyl ester carboxylesterase
MTINWPKVQPAQRVGGIEHSTVHGLKSLNLQFSVPLRHIYDDKKQTEFIDLHAELVYSNPPRIVSPGNASKSWELGLSRNDRIVVYLCGGPGDKNPASANPDLNRILLKRWGHPILFLDYRGTGGSSPVDATAMAGKVDGTEYLTWFRQDSIVADLEAIRLSLNGVRFILVGQSFGGWIAMTYLSFLPSGLDGVYLTGGMPPIGKTPREVYTALYERLIHVNEKYYARYQGDRTRVKEIVKWLASLATGLPLLDGQVLTARGFLTLGRHLGRGEEGFAKVHSLVSAFAADIRDNNLVSGESLNRFVKEGGTGFKLPQRPLYGVLHEAIYCSGSMAVAPDWAGQKVGREQPSRNFAWLKNDFNFSALNSHFDSPEPLYFTGEMIHEFMLRDAGRELAPFVEPAQELARKTLWSSLYDTTQLSRNDVPVGALIYPEDMFLDCGLCIEAAGMVRNLKPAKSQSDWIHASIKTRPGEVCDALFGLQPLDSSK